MSKKSDLEHPADAFSQTLLTVQGAGMRELRDPVARASAVSASDQFSQFKIRLATSDGQKRLARMLVQRMYATRGYDSDADGPAQEAGETTGTKEVDAPTQLTLVVSDRQERPQGTMSMVFDVGHGLPADEVFKDLLDPLRLEGRRLIEIGRLAIDRSEGSKRLFAGMIHVFLIYSTVIHRYTDWIIEVNPRHVGYYQKMIGMDVLSEVRNCPRVDAPAVLLRIKLADMLARSEAVGGQGRNDKTERSLYPYFLSKEDARGLAHRLLTDYLF